MPLFGTPANTKYRDEFEPVNSLHCLLKAFMVLPIWRKAKVKTIKRTLLLEDGVSMTLNVSIELISYWAVFFQVNKIRLSNVFTLGDILYCKN